MLYYMVGDFMTFEVFINELKKLNPNVKFEINSENNQLFSSVSITDLILPNGFYCEGDLITTINNVFGDEKIFVEVKKIDYLKNNKFVNCYNKYNYTQKEINSLLYNYLNNINDYSVLKLGVQTSKNVLTQLYVLYLKLINKIDKFSFNSLKELEDKIYTINGVRLSELNSIKYEFSKLDSNTINATNTEIKKDIERLVIEIKELLNKLTGNVLMKNEKKSLILNELKKKIVILQILMGRRVTFFESSCELLFDCCKKINYENSNNYLK